MINVSNRNLAPMPGHQAIPDATSVFLDFLRITAAVLVFFHHCAQFWSPILFVQTNHLAHSAVVVFFVLSGYVISYSTLSRARDVRRFAVARLARLYSVVIPALLLTGILYIVGKGINPAFYEQHSRGSESIRYLLTICLMQNIWHFAASPPTNSPFWSLSYEFWYYTFFGIAIFVRRFRLKVGMLILCALVCGPNILLLYPCWLLGVCLYLKKDRHVGPALGRWWMFGLAMSFAAAVFIFMPPFPYDLSRKDLLFSGSFLSDWVFALAVGAVIRCFEALGPVSIVIRSGRLIRAMADHTFSLYLYHFPLIAFVTAAWPARHWSALHAVPAATGILLVIYLLSSFTEGRRDAWKRAFETVLSVRPAQILRRNDAPKVEVQVPAR